MEHIEEFRRVWARVRETYESGYMLYEAGLQAALYMELRRQFPERRVVVEPHWGYWNEQEESQVPDLVIVSRNEISDIFELKFKPHEMLRFDKISDDIRKLLDYKGNKEVKLDPRSGQFAEQCPIRDACLRHLVVVTKQGAEAVLPENIPDGIIHWYGRVSNQPEQFDWHVCLGEDPD